MITREQDLQLCPLHARFSKVVAVLNWMMKCVQQLEVTNKYIYIIYILCSKTVNELSFYGPYVGILGNIIGIILPTILFLHHFNSSYRVLFIFVCVYLLSQNRFPTHSCDV